MHMSHINIVHKYTVLKAEILTSNFATWFPYGHGFYGRKIRRSKMRPRKARFEGKVDGVKRLCSIE